MFELELTPAKVVGLTVFLTLVFGLRIYGYIQKRRFERDMRLGVSRTIVPRITPSASRR